MAEKFDKADVDYSKGMASRHCGKMFDSDKGYCSHFIDTTIFDGKCELVKGPIKRDRWCNKWDKAVTK